MARLHQSNHNNGSFSAIRSQLGPDFSNASQLRCDLTDLITNLARIRYHDAQIRLDLAKTITFQARFDLNTHKKGSINLIPSQFGLDLVGYVTILARCSFVGSQLRLVKLKKQHN